MLVRTQQEANKCFSMGISIVNDKNVCRKLRDRMKLPNFEEIAIRKDTEMLAMAVMGDMHSKDNDALYVALGVSLVERVVYYQALICQNWKNRSGRHYYPYLLPKVILYDLFARLS